MQGGGRGCHRTSGFARPVRPQHGPARPHRAPTCPHGFKTRRTHLSASREVAGRRRTARRKLQALLTQTDAAARGAPPARLTAHARGCSLKTGIAALMRGQPSRQALVATASTRRTDTRHAGHPAAHLMRAQHGGGPDTGAAARVGRAAAWRRGACASPSAVSRAWNAQARRALPYGHLPRRGQVRSTRLGAADRGGGAMGTGGAVLGANGAF